MVMSLRHYFHLFLCISSLVEPYTLGNGKVISLASAGRRGVQAVQLITITLNEQQDAAELQKSLFEQLRQFIQQLHKKYLKELYQIHDDDGRVVISAVMPHFRLERDASPFYQMLSKCIADWMVNHLEPRLLQKYIAEEGEYEGAVVHEIMKYCNLVLNQEDGIDLDPEIGENWDRRKKLADAIREHLETHTWLNLDGLLTFRLHFYTEELRDIVQYAIDEYIMEQQYQEFIHLLKYFVLVQESKMPEVHILHRPGDQIEIWNERLEPIQISDLSSFVMETIDQDIRFEDMVISTLISAAPEKICIHTREPEMQMIKTIEQIFEERTQICTSCATCQPVLDNKQLDQPSDPIYNN